ncbi:MAG: molecular chaperone HscB [Acidobacteriaceae bacterium]|jgi:molecular chaperone HscB|nr:molecular chaperone HscB [Acidobacteriaceae bacterium]MEA2262769.1 molecular chaperone HscB [Acidobacteriaceae bacterium]
MQITESVSAPAKCWSCGEEVADGQPFCGSCGKVQPPQPANYFAMFGLPPKLNLDVPALEKQFYRYSRKLHPDVHARASQQEQEWSLAQASLLNDAYRTLKSPLDRTKYLLRLEGVQFEEDRGPNPSKVPADLLEEVFELNMQLEELRQNQKMGEDDPQLRRDLEGAKDQFATQLSALDEQVRSRWSAWDEAWQENDEARKTAAKEAMTALLQRRSYLQNLVRDVDQTLGGS